MKNESLAKLGTWSQAVFSKKEGSDVEQPTVHFIPKKLSYIKVVVQPLASMPSWHGNKGKPSKVLVGEVVLN
jgi:hexosaminidase